MKYVSITVLLLFLGGTPASAETSGTQYPALLANSYVGLQVGYIDYRFSNTQLETGFKADSIQVPHLAARVLLFGHEFNQYLSGQIAYMRSVQWVHYQSVNGDGIGHSVWMNVAGLTLKGRLPITKTVSAYGEGGIGIVTRKGFDVGESPALKDANYGTFLMGGGLQYRVNDNWDLVAGMTTSPPHSGPRQPRTSLVTMGFNYTMRPLSEAQVQAKANVEATFPQNVVQIGYSTDALGYGLNDFVSKGAVPVFWAADTQVAHGFSGSYQRTVFHTERVFALDWGASVASWKSKTSGEDFYTASLYPLLRFTVLRSKSQDFYLDYSLAGPTLISRTIIDNNETGRKFTFQDFMGVGIFTGRKRNINAEVKIAHFSNGNIFPRNAGVTVPLSFSLGYAF